MLKISALIAFLLVANAAQAANCTDSTTLSISAVVATAIDPTHEQITYTTNLAAAGMVITGNDGNANGEPGPGGFWFFDSCQSTGCTSHTVDLTNLIPGSTGGSVYQYLPVARCFTGANPDNTKQVIGTLATYSTANPTVTANVLTYALQIIVPVQDGTHNGFLAGPSAFDGANHTYIPFTASPSIIPTGGYQLFSTHALNIVFSGSLFSNYSLSWIEFDGNGAMSTSWVTTPIQAGLNSCGTIFICSGIDLKIPASVPTGGSGCTANAGAVDLGGGQCAYPVTMTVTSSDSNCGGTLTCNNPSPLNFYIIVYRPSFVYGTGGATHVPCLHEADKVADSCTFDDSGDSHNNTNYSFDGLYAGTSPSTGATNWGTLYSLRTPIFNGNNTSNHFYEGGNVIKRLGTYLGSSSPWNGYEQNILYNLRDRQFLPLIQETSAYIPTLTQSAVTLNNNSTCAAIASNGNALCGTMTVTFSGNPDLSGLVAALAAGQTFAGTANWDAHVNHILSADNVAKTITYEWQDAAGAPANGSTYMITREVNNIAADAGSTSTSIVSAGTDVSGVVANDICYIPSNVSATWSISTKAGALVSSVAGHTITLSGGGISGFTTGSKFQCRHPTQVGSFQIFTWSAQLLDDWNLNGDYIALDTINYMSGIQSNGIAPLVGLGEEATDNQRELSLVLRTCRVALDVSSITTAKSAGTRCTTAANLAVFVDAMFTLLDLEVDNCCGKGTAQDTFLDGPEAIALIEMQRSANSGYATDKRIDYWLKKLADFLFVQGYQYPASVSSNCYFHEWGYILEYVQAGPGTGTGCTGGVDIGISGATYVRNNGQTVGAFNSEQGLIWPLYARLCFLMGTVPVIPSSSPSTTYCAAFQDMFRFGVAQSQQAWDSTSAPGGKTVGQQGAAGMMFDAFTWMAGGNVVGLVPGRPRGRGSL